MSDLKICKRCFYSSNHPLESLLMKKVLIGCRIHEEKDNLDWNKRWDKLEKIVLSYRNKSKYDCIFLSRVLRTLFISCILLKKN